MTVIRIYEVVKAHGYYEVGDIRAGAADSAILAQAVRGGVLRLITGAEWVTSFEPEPEKKPARVKKMKTVEELKEDGTPGL